MSELIVPPIPEETPWPSLGGDVGEWMEDALAFGPGDLLGQPFRIDAEDRAILERAYQVYPPDHSGPCHIEAGRCTQVQNARCGRRRFDTVVLMTRKGTKKSERLAAVAAAELSGDSPVRGDGFRKRGRLLIPVGRPVISPFVWILAFAKEQAEDTSFEAMRQMILLGPAADRFDVWEERIVRRDGTGQAQALATAPDSRDGGKTTFQGKEEGHRWVLPRQKEAHQTTRGNLSKRPIAEPWEMHATTMYAPGEGSVAEEFHDAAKKLSGNPEAARLSRMFFFYRWADNRIRIRNEDGSFNRANLREAIIDASGPVVSQWSDPDGIASLQFLAPGADPDYAERVWLNRGKKRTETAFDAEAWKRNVKPGEIAKGSTVVAFFDGSRGSDDPKRTPDHTGIVITDVATGRQQAFAHWDPLDYPGHKIPRDIVDIAVDDLMATFDVWRLGADPPDWDQEIDGWAGKYGERVVKWHTWRPRPMGMACANFAMAISTGAVFDNGNPALAAHIGHAHKRPLNERDDKGERLWGVQKERPDSQLKIDLCVCAIGSWEMRGDALAAGVTNDAEFHSVYETRGPVVVRW